jgi:ArsR family transcriptional regulator, arsenate/arsenite/antimonite-responsive transcriptional repressor
MSKTDNKILKAKADILKALAHPSRLLMVEALSEKTLCVCELQTLVGADMSTVSKHLSVLKHAGVVTDEKRGTSVYYSLSAACVISFLSCIDEMIINDAKERTNIARACSRR